MAGYLPKFMPGAAVTFTAEADITGGQLVEVVGDRAVQPAGADSAAVAGVASRDAKIGEQVTVYALRGAVHKLVASAAIAAGDQVSAAANGQVGDAGTNIIGLALTSAAAAGDVIEVQS